MKQIEKEIEGNRRGVKMQEMPIDKAYELLKEAYEDYSNAKYMVARAKREKADYVRKRENEADSVKIRVKNIFMSCPKLWEFVKDDFFQPNYFASDFAELMSKLKEEVEN